MKTHWKKSDDRIKSLETIIKHLNNSIKEVKSNIQKVTWYDALWFLEESEPIIGLMFIALQNYINSSIYDKYESLDKKNEKYKIGEKIKYKDNTIDISKIELIICIANYYKHRDDDNILHRGTANILERIGLKYENNSNIEHSPITRSLELLVNDQDPSNLINIATKWRSLLWDENV